MILGFFSSPILVARPSETIFGSFTGYMHEQRGLKYEYVNKGLLDDCLLLLGTGVRGRMLTVLARLEYIGTSNNYALIL